MKLKIYFKKMLLSILLSGSIMSLNATIHVIDANHNLVFVPALLEDVIVGDTIRWVNVGAEIHTTTSVTIPQGAAVWDYTFTGDGDIFDYEVTTPGRYEYTCTLHPGMDGVFVASEPTNVQELAKIKFITYPNPVKNNMFVVFDEAFGHQIDWKVTDFNGRVIFGNQVALREKTLELNFSDLADGVYILHLNDRKNYLTKKIIKTR